MSRGACRPSRFQRGFNGHHTGYSSADFRCHGHHLARHDGGLTCAGVGAGANSIRRIVQRVRWGAYEPLGYGLSGRPHQGQVRVGRVGVGHEPVDRGWGTVVNREMGRRARRSDVCPR